MSCRQDAHSALLYHGQPLCRQDADSTLLCRGRCARPAHHADGMSALCSSWPWSRARAGAD